MRAPLRWTWRRGTFASLRAARACLACVQDFFFYNCEVRVDSVTDGAESREQKVNKRCCWISALCSLRLLHFGPEGTVSRTLRVVLLSRSSCPMTLMHPRPHQMLTHWLSPGGGCKGCWNSKRREQRAEIQQHFFVNSLLSAPCALCHTVDSDLTVIKKKIEKKKVTKNCQG